MTTQHLDPRADLTDDTAEGTALLAVVAQRLKGTVAA